MRPDSRFLSGQMKPVCPCLISRACKVTTFWWWDKDWPRVFSHNPIFKFCKCSLIADKRLRSGLKAQQAYSPGHRPG